MLIYIIFLLFFIFLAFYNYIYPKANINRNSWNLIILLLIIFAGCRKCGFDYAAYQEIYENLISGGKQGGGNFVEPLYMLINYVSPDYQCVLFITALISIYFTLRALISLWKNNIPFLGLLMLITNFFLSVYMGQIRQGLAIGFILYYFILIMHEKKRKSLLFLFLGVCSHVSALTSIVGLYIKNKRWKISTYLVTLSLIVIVGLYIIPIFIPYLFDYSFGIVEKLIYYLQTDGDISISTIIIRIITFILAYIILENNSRNNYIINLYFFGICFYILCSSIPNLASRGGYYYIILECVIWPLIISSLISKKYIYSLSFFAIIFVSIFRYIRLFVDNSSNAIEEYIPYR